jgi:hypothetical protein
MFSCVMLMSQDSPKISLFNTNTMMRWIKLSHDMLGEAPLNLAVITVR